MLRGQQGGEGCRFCHNAIRAVRDGFHGLPGPRDGSLNVRLNGQSVRASLGNLKGLPAPGILQPVPEAAATSTGEQPELPNSCRGGDRRYPVNSGSSLPVEAVVDDADSPLRSNR
jgi:hypothetical protein